MSIADLEPDHIAPVVALHSADDGTRPEASQLDADQIRIGLARELHDQVAQNLTALLVQTRTFARTHQHDREAVAHFAYVHASVLETLNRLRNILYDLRGQSVMDGDLARTVKERLLPKFEQTRMKVRLAVGRSWPDALPPETCIHLYRIIQEALTNAYRHGGARSTEVHLRVTGNLLVCTIRDDGSGIAWLDESEAFGMGILGMKERAEILGGLLTIRNRPQGGTTVTASFAKEVLLWQSTPRPSAS